MRRDMSEMRKRIERSQYPVAEVTHIYNLNTSMALIDNFDELARQELKKKNESGSLESDNNLNETTSAETIQQEKHMDDNDNIVVIDETPVIDQNKPLGGIIPLPKDDDANSKSPYADDPEWGIIHF